MSEYLLRKVWRQMHRRCECPRDQRYERYGGRGITVCEDWNDFSVFLNWALSSGYSKGLSVERIDNDGNYEPSNCRWATPKEQANNTERNHRIEWNGENHTIAEWSEITRISEGTIWRRIYSGWTPERALTENIRQTTIEYNGEIRRLADWSRMTGLAENTIVRRLQRGWSVEDALTKKSQRGKSI